ncbi:hypothetical protein [Arthrobacter sp. B0490]|uniref:hypothetical protein n=1 Tax=Arthrobacter sp. B0490 TaxID=2058891 RepID=UPI000CE48A23|nr:hypothetical protein [Arthrobacter sp. B0490]
MGVDDDGGWADYVVVPAGVLVPLGDGFPSERAAIIPDAAPTPRASSVSTGREWAADVPFDSAGVDAVRAEALAGLGLQGGRLARQPIIDRSSSRWYERLW